MSLVCSVIFIHHAFNANILDKDYAFSDGEILIIAEQCGYASTSYFIYAFRKHFGNSPKRVSKEYRCQRHTGMNTDNKMSALAI
ncbi:AraC family transcriptional regulator [Escherichia coli]|nr:AraC family transcriptional regulator [Escherichia coli]HAX2327411.1 AraC family transcriptional regulator [Escherichia coli]